MKKATNPLALDLRAGGFEVFPIAKLFDLPSNVWYPSILIRENMLENRPSSNGLHGASLTLFASRHRQNRGEGFQHRRKWRRGPGQASPFVAVRRSPRGSSRLVVALYLNRRLWPFTAPN